jgi:P27 family predicted phage terminase small subunit
MTASQVPSHLGTKARAWAESVLTEAGSAASETDLKLVTLAAEALDRASTARRQIAREGITYTDRFGAPRAHPAVAIERDARAAFSRLVAQLGLDDTDPEMESYRGANGRRYERRKGS